MKYFLDSPLHLVGEDTTERGAPCIKLAGNDGEWRVTLVDTGLSSNVGERLKAVEPFLKDEPVFLANYTDGLSDIPLPVLIKTFKRSQAVGVFVSVRPNASFHFARCDADGRVLSIEDVKKANVRVNGGYFVFSNKIFDYIRAGEELVEEPFGRLIEAGKLFAVEYDGFWRCIDTFKDLQALENLLSGGHAPWMFQEETV